MKNLRILFLLLSVTILTAFSFKAKAQTYQYYVFTGTFNAAASSPNTSALNGVGYYTLVNSSDPADDGNFFWGFKVSPSIPTPDQYNNFQGVVDAIKVKADGRIAANTPKWLRHDNSFTAFINGTTYTITTYLQSTSN